jgi:hypothetical protein
VESLNGYLTVDGERNGRTVFSWLGNRHLKYEMALMPLGEGEAFCQPHDHVLGLNGIEGEKRVFGRSLKFHRLNFTAPVNGENRNAAFSELDSIPHVI